nr:DegV family protein [bacterium]
MSRPVHVMTDSTNDMPADILKRYNVSVVPLYVQLGENSLSDVAITPQEIFDYVAQTGQLPRTSAFTIPDVLQAAQTWVDKGYDVLMITISQKLSSCYEVSMMASRELPEGRMRVVDSTHLSGSVGNLVLRAAEMAEQGMALEEIAQAVEEIATRTYTSFFVDTVKYLYYGGRCSALQLMGSVALKLHPVIVMPDGQLVPGEKLRGSAVRCVEPYLQNHIPDWDAIEGPRIFMNYTGPRCEVEERVVEIIHQKRPDLEIIERHAGSIVSCHCGPGTMGVLFTLKK